MMKIIVSIVVLMMLCSSAFAQISGTYYISGDGDASCTGEDESIASDPAVTTPGSDYTLSSTSPCIDAGADVASDIGCTNNGTCVDYSGRQIPNDGDNNGTETVDMGAYEYRYPSLLGPYGFTIAGGAIQGGAQ